MQKVPAVLNREASLTPAYYPQISPTRHNIQMGENASIKFHPNTPEWLIIAYSGLALAATNAKALQAFVLSITDRCNIKCDFCCHPYQNSELSESDCIRLVLEALALPFDEICVTGGEPYLRRALVYKLASMCRRQGRLFGSITNGFWAQDRNRAFELATEMIETGIARVTFSWDPSHGEFIKPETIQNGIDACVNAGMRVCLTGSFKQRDDNHENYGIVTSEYEQYDTFTVDNSYVAPAGWGRSLINVYREPISPAAATGLRCPGGEIHELVLYAQHGLVQPCCSVHAGYDMPELRIGDWRKQPVAELLDAQQGDPFYRVIVDGGFSLLFKIIQERDSDVSLRLPNPENTWSACHLCELLMVGRDAKRIRQLCDEFIGRLTPAQDL